MDTQEAALAYIALPTHPTVDAALEAAHGQCQAVALVGEYHEVIVEQSPLGGWVAVPCGSPAWYVYHESPNQPHIIVDADGGEDRQYWHE